MPRPVLVAGFALAVSGFTALGYEVLWTRALEFYTHNSTYAYSAMLAVFLLGIGLGSGLVARWSDRLREPLLTLAVLEIAIGVTVTAGLLLYSRYDILIPKMAAALGGLDSWGNVILLIFSEAGLVLLATTLLFGATFPVGASVVVQSLGTVGQRIGGLYTANTVGSIVGSLVAGFLLLPLLGMRTAFLVLALVNVLLGVGLALGTSAGRRGRIVAAGGVAVAVAMFVVVPPTLFQDSYARRFGPLLFYHEQVTDTVMVTEDDKGERMIRFGDGRGTAGTLSVREDRMYAHVPMLLHPNPRRILSICFGVGNSLAALTRYDVDHVDAVELSPGVVAAAPFFESTNRNVLSDPRVTLTIADGRNYLLTTDDLYDVIRLDPPELHTAGVVNLYTREFLEQSRDHLAPGGIFSIWVNIVMTPDEDMRLLVRTIASVFPHVSIWHGPYHYSWVINGSMESHAPDLVRLMERFAMPEPRVDLESIGVRDPFEFLFHFVMMGEDVQRFAGTGPIVTDDHTRLDFTVARSIDSSFGFANANTAGWLTEFMPGEHGQAGIGTFFRKVAHFDTFKRPVLPHLLNVDAAGFDAQTVQARIAAAGPRPADD